MRHPSTTDRQVLLTGEDLLAMGDVGPCALIDGRIVPMTPAGGEHGRIEWQLTLDLGLFVRERELGWVLTGGVGIYTQRDPDRVRGADVAFVSRERLPGGPGKGYLTVAPELVVEITSPTDRGEDILQKVEEYLAIGVDRVWVVDPDDWTVTVYSSGPGSRRLSRRLGEGDELRGEGVLEGFARRVAQLFEG